MLRAPTLLSTVFLLGCIPASQPVNRSEISSLVDFEILDYTPRDERGFLFRMRVTNRAQQGELCTVPPTHPELDSIEVQLESSHPEAEYHTLNISFGEVSQRSPLRRSVPLESLYDGEFDFDWRANASGVRILAGAQTDERDQLRESLQGETITATASLVVHPCRFRTHFEAFENDASERIVSNTFGPFSIVGSDP